MTKKISQYEKLGIDPDKKNVRKIFGKRVKNDFPGAFVNIVRDPQYKGDVFTQHMDGDGSKFVQRLLIFRETGDVSVLAGMVDDALSMNLSDIAASGFVNGPITVTDVINVNAFAIDKDLLMEVIGKRFDELFALYARYGFELYFLGGETADLPDQVKSGVFDIAVHARTKEVEIIRGNAKPGDFIWGFPSNGQAVWEDTYNSGIMSNGLTLARTSLMWSGYTTKYPDLIRDNSAYVGDFQVNETDALMPSMSVDRAIISPTRQWPILIKILLDKVRIHKMQRYLHGISINTGGGATKIQHVGKGMNYHKSMPDPPEIFHLIQKKSQESWKNMYRTFNCGIGVDIIGDQCLTPLLHEVEKDAGVMLLDLGVCGKSTEKQNTVTLHTPFGVFSDY